MTSHRDQRAYSASSGRQRRHPALAGLILLVSAAMVVSFALGQTVSGPAPGATPIPGVTPTTGGAGIFARPDSALSSLIASHGVIFAPLSGTQEAALGSLPSFAAVAGRAQSLLQLAYGPSAIYLGLVSSSNALGASPGAGGGLAPTAAYAAVFLSSIADIPVGQKSYRQVFLFLDARSGNGLLEIGLD